MLRISETQNINLTAESVMGIEEDLCVFLDDGSFPKASRSMIPVSMLFLIQAAS
jgi:hypothetical protein